jgi:iron complex transport system ATP-binding protein
VAGDAPVPLTVPAVLECAGLTVTVPGRTLVHGLSLSLEPGRVVAVLGRNGAGKSSLLHALAGLRAGAAGEVSWFGRALAEWPRREFARRVAILPQAIEDPFPGTVLEAALVGRHPHLGFWQWETDADREIARGCLAEVDLADLGHRDLESLSGGERRRLALAAVLAQQPEAYLLDEPIQQLDPRHQVAVLQLLRSLADAGRTVVLTLHDVGLAARYADEALLVYGDGRWRHGPAATALNARDLGELYGIEVREFAWPGGRTFVPA